MTGPRTGGLEALVHRQGEQPLVASGGSPAHPFLRRVLAKLPVVGCQGSAARDADNEMPPVFPRVKSPSRTTRTLPLLVVAAPHRLVPAFARPVVHGSASHVAAGATQRDSDEGLLVVTRFTRACGLLRRASHLLGQAWLFRRLGSGLAIPILQEFL